MSRDTPVRDVFERQLGTTARIRASAVSGSTTAAGDCGVPAPPPAQPGSGPGTGPVMVTPSAAPRITVFSVTNRRFRVGRKATALTAAKRRPAKLRKRRACVLYVKRGTLRRAGRSGANRLAFSGRLGRKALPAGSYRARIVATDAGGRRSGSRTLLFTVVRR